MLLAMMWLLSSAFGSEQPPPADVAATVVSLIQAEDRATFRRAHLGFQVDPQGKLQLSWGYSNALARSYLRHPRSSDQLLELETRLRAIVEENVRGGLLRRRPPGVPDSIWHITEKWLAEVDVHEVRLAVVERSGDAVGWLDKGHLVLE